MAEQLPPFEANNLIRQIGAAFEAIQQQLVGIRQIIEERLPAPPNPVHPGGATGLHAIEGGAQEPVSAPVSDESANTTNPVSTETGLNTQTTGTTRIGA